METKLITKGDNVKPIAKKKSTGKKNTASPKKATPKKEPEVIFNPDDVPERKAAYEEALLVTKKAWAIYMKEAEFKTLFHSNSDVHWVDTIVISSGYVFGKWRKLDENEISRAKSYVLHYPSEEPGKIYQSLYLYRDNFVLYKASSIEELVNISNALKIQWLFEEEVDLFYDNEYKRNKAAEKAKKTESQTPKTAVI